MAKTKTTIMERLKGGYESACKELGITPCTLEQFSFLGERAAPLFAIHKIITVIEAINEGHKFDWNSWKEEKHFPVWDLETYGAAPAGSGWSLDDVRYGHTCTSVGARLSTRNSEHARFVAELMDPEYQIWIKG